MAVVDVLCSPADRIVLAPPGSVLKTSSGKIRRGATRQRYLQGTIGRRRRVWWQVTRFAVGGIGTRLRRAGRALSNTLFGVWCWTAFAAVALPTLLVVSLLPRQAWRRAAARRGVIALLRITGTPLAVHGRERLPRDRPVVIVANHASYLDSFALTAVLPASCTFVAGEIFGRKPVIGFVLRRLGVEFVERARHEQAVADAQRIARKSAGGETFVFFPEGGLSTTPGLRPFHLGAFVVAATTGRPVVPVAIAGTRWMLPPGAPVVRPGMIHITLLDPIGPAGSTWDDAVALQRTVRASILHHCGEADIA